MPELLDGSPEEAFSSLYNGGVCVRESGRSHLVVPPQSLDDLELVVSTVRSDADYVDSMTGNLAEVYLRDAAVPDRWLDDLEFCDKLHDLAD